MRFLKITLLILALCGASFMSPSCSSQSPSQSGNQTATVQRGNLTVSITASGNLALSVTQDLAFETAGTVQEILVEAGDSVTEGQVLARLDTSAWQTELIKLERALLQAQISLENAQLALYQAQQQTSTSTTGDIITTGTTSSTQIHIKQLQLELARGQLDDAQKAFDEAQNASPEIKAPFDGFITNVNKKGGDEVTKGTVAVTIADPNKFETDILVSEMNIPKVKQDAQASVQADAITGITLPAKVTHISPTATISSGVVNYKVKVVIQSLQSAGQQQQAPWQAGQNMTLPPGQNTTLRPGQNTTQQGQMPATTAGSTQLRQGMTVTVSIVVQQRTNVLLVPTAAIATSGRQAYVQVLLSGVATEQRSIQTGISSGQFTEVSSGLSEGEKVIVPKGTTTTSTSTPGQQAPGGIPGGFGIFR